MQHCSAGAQPPNPYTTIIDAISDLHERGYSADFNLLGNRLFCSQTKFFLSADEFDVLEMYSFDEETGTEGETIVYGIESSGKEVRGILFQASIPGRGTIQGILLSKISKFWK